MNHLRVILVPPVPIVVVAERDVLSVALPATNAVIHRLTVRIAAVPVLDLTRIRNGKTTTLKFTRKKIVCRKNGIIVQKMSLNPIVNRMGIDVIGEGLGREMAGDIDLRPEDVRHVIDHQDFNGIGMKFVIFL